MSSSSEKRRGGAKPDQTQDKLLDLVGPVEDVTGNRPLGETAVEAIASTKLPLQSSYGNAAVARSLIQLKAEGEEVSGVAAAASESAPASPASGEAPAAVSPVRAPATEPSRPLLVEDSAETVEPGQMKKSEFLSQLRAAVVSTTADALAGSSSSAVANPYIDSVFAQYSGQSCAQLERIIRRDAPEAGAVTSASGFIPIITGRVRRSLTTWITTGAEPQGLPLGLPGGGVSGAVNAAASGIGSAVSAAGSLLFKEHDGGASADTDPETIQGQLGTGQALDGGVRARMESAFGKSFSGVEVHADSNAAGLAGDLNARAFTVGGHVAFGAGEYQPGTLVGDALIAHELAHVAQQRGGGAALESKHNGVAGHNALEEDADTSAVGAVVSIWSGVKGSLKVARNSVPRLKTGLRLQSCNCTKGSKPAPKVLDASKMTDAEIEATAEYKAYMDPTLQWQTKHKMTREEALLAYRLMVRAKAEGTTVTWPADAEAFMNLARRQLGTLKQAEGLKGKLEWVQVTGEHVQGITPWKSDFGKWLVAGGAEPASATGKVNCWEMILFSSYKGGYTTKKRLEDIYNEGIKKEKDGTRIFPETIVKELRRGKEYVFDPKDPDSPTPLPGDIVIFTEAANHVAIAIGTEGGKHKVISHWPPPDGSHKTKETTIEELLAKMQPGQVVKFWSPSW